MRTPSSMSWPSVCVLTCAVSHVTRDPSRRPMAPLPYPGPEPPVPGDRAKGCHAERVGDMGRGMAMAGGVAARACPGQYAVEGKPGVGTRRGMQPPWARGEEEGETVPPAVALQNGRRGDAMCVDAFVTQGGRGAGRRRVMHASSSHLRFVPVRGLADGVRGGRGGVGQVSGTSTSSYMTPSSAGGKAGGHRSNMSSSSSSSSFSSSSSSPSWCTPKRLVTRTPRSWAMRDRRIRRDTWSCSDV